MIANVDRCLFEVSHHCGKICIISINQILLYVSINELLRCFIVVSSSHLHPQAPQTRFDVLFMLACLFVNCLHCFELTEPLLFWLGMSNELFSMRY